MKKAAFFTLGCKVNQYETEAITGLFKKEGYQVVDFEETADVYVINTCTVTNLSDRKSRQMIRRAKKNNPESIVVVAGCYAQTAPDEVLEIPGVNAIVGTKDRSSIVEIVRQIEAGRDKISAVGNIMSVREFEDLKVDTYKERTRAFLKIQEGCSQFCAYCIIPYARGPIRSRNPEDVVREVEELAGGGFKEVVLTGIHVASYGKDLKNTSLLDIIARIHGIEGVERIRLGSIEPTIITDAFVEAVRSMNKLCPHYHISLQSGCDETLKRMNRRYDAHMYLEGVQLLRSAIPDVAITTDVMVGFPGETDAEFQKTCAFLEEIQFSQMHVFKYSPRKGTPAAKFEGQVNPEVKEDRSRKIIALSEANHRKYLEGFEGKTLEVLFEQEVRDEKGYIEGLTPNYIRVVCPGTSTHIGEIRRVKAFSVDKDFLVGELLG